MCVKQSTVQKRSCWPACFPSNGKLTGTHCAFVQSIRLLCCQKHFQIWAKRQNQTIVIMHCTAAASLQVVDHLLLGYEVRGLVDQWHERVEFVWPVVEQVVGVFGPLEVDDACQPVHLGVDGLVDHQGGEELFRFLVWEGSGSVWIRTWVRKSTTKKKISHMTGLQVFTNSSLSIWTVRKLWPSASHGSEENEMKMLTSTERSRSPAILFIVILV